MKKIITFLFVLSFVFLGLNIGGCTNNPISENLDGYIANLSLYSNIGVATINNKSNALNLEGERIGLTALAIENNSSDANNNKTCLVGLDINNQVKQIQFHNQNNSVNAQLNVVSFNQTNRYILITYTNKDVEKINDNQFWSDNEHRTYIIDKQTKSVFKIDLFEHFVIGMYGYGIVGSDCGDYIVISAGRNNAISYFKVGVENEKLKINEIFSQYTISSGAEIRLCDKYGNCVIRRYDNTYCILNKDGILKSVDFDLDICGGINNPGTTYRAIDGCIYHNQKVLNQNGEFVDTPSVMNKYILPSEALVYSTDLADYYFLAKPYDVSRNYMWFYNKTMIKVNKNGVQHTFEEIAFDVNEQGFQSGENFYSFRNDRDIIKVNILTGAHQVISLNNDIIINSISVYAYNEISFIGINETLQIVKGIIEGDGTIVYAYEEPDFTTYFLQPII